MCVYSSGLFVILCRRVRAHSMLMRLEHSISEAVAVVRRAVHHWWGGIGCRVAFLLSLAIVLVASLIGAFLLREARRSQQAEMRGRALYVASYFSALAADDIRAEDRAELYRKMMPAFLAPGDASRDLLYVTVYGRTGAMLIGSSPRRVPLSDANGGEVPVEESLDPSVLGRSAPLVRQLDNNILDVVMPVMIEDERVGFVKVGLSRASIQERFGDVTSQIVLVVAVILVLGILFSQIIAAGIVKPIARLGAAVDELGKQNWKVQIPIQGRDEISRLAGAFNQMAQALQQRDLSLSQGNRDLFILHTAGLDLMESPDLPVLLEKISARAQDLIKADTITIAAVDRSTRLLHYLNAEGSKARFLGARDLPMEAGGIYNWLVSYGTPLLIQDALADFRLDGGLMTELGIRSVIAVPLWSSNSLIAILTAVDKRGGEAFDRNDLRLFTVFANLAAAALQNAFFYEDLKQRMKELKHTQQQLVHSTKMAAIGELAANVAHEINNPMTSVLGYASHLLKTLPLPEESKKKLQMMEQETLRVRKIIRNLLDFSRQRPSRMRPGNLAGPLKETTALLQGVAERSSVHIVEEYPAEPVVVNMDHNEIKQVFINIMNNALHAMPEGGELRIGLAAAGAGEASVEFQDTGHGIVGELIAKVFEPFFTTKNSGDGTGLGLSISHRIIQNHGGRIDVTSTPEKGSLFRIVLPLAEQRPAVGGMNSEV